MSTSLAEQLQQLAVPQTSLLKRDKKRASLLFDPKDAATLKRETVYQIGLEGLEELISKNEVFEQFRETLFSVTSRNYERSIQNFEANQTLDKNIRKFLLLLSPYFLLNCSHKAIEWLINRYMINEYNREDLLMLILPYHESNIFVRLVQLLQFENQNDSWYFLKSLQKSGTHLPKQSLLNHAANNSGFLKFVTKFILQLIRAHKNPSLLTVAFNFYCSVFCGAIEYTDEAKEDQVSQMLLLIFLGLKSDIADFCAASYVVTARLVSKTSLSDKLLDKIVEKISEVKIQSLKTEACLVLLVLYQSQKQYTSMPAVAVANLSEKEWLPKILQDLNVSGSFIYPFLAVIIKRATEEGVYNDLTLPKILVKNFLDQIKLDDCFVSTFLNCIVDCVKCKKSLKCSEESNHWLSDVLQTLERQYPNAFDKEVYNILSNTQMNKRKKSLQKLLKNTVTYQGKFDIFQKLYHPNPECRGEAIKYLMTNYESLKDNDKEIIKNSFIDRLNDDNANVVKQTLTVVEKADMLEKHTLKNILVNLATKCKINKDNNWKEISSNVLNLLCKETSFEWDIFLAVFPFLLPNNEDELRESKIILKQPFFSSNSFLKSIKGRLLSTNSSDAFIKVLFKCLQENGSIDFVKDFVHILKTIPAKDRDLLHKYVVSIILTNILPTNSSLDISILVLEILVEYFKTCQNKSDKSTSSSVTDNVATAIKSKLPTVGYLKCIENVITKTRKQKINLGLTDFSNESNNFFVLIASVLVSDSVIYHESLDVCLNYFCKDLQSKVDFLLNLCILNNSNFKNNFKVSTLKYVLNALNSEESVKTFILIEHITPVYLLVLLADPDENVRKITLDVVKHFVKLPSRKTESYFYLLEGLLKYKEEILVDHEQVPLILFNILAPENVKRKKNVKDLNTITNTLFQVTCSNESPVYLKSEMMKILSVINTHELFEETSKLALTILQEKSDVIDSFKAIIIVKNVSRIDAQILGKIKFNSNIWNFIETTLKMDKTLIVIDVDNKISLPALILGQFTKEVFSVLDKEVVKKLLDIICEISIHAQNPEVLPAANRIFKHIDLDAKLILDQFTAMRDVRSPKQDTCKKRRTSVIPTVDILDTLEWKKGVSMLEFIQDKKKIQNTNSLLPILFEILKKCLDFDEQAAVEYEKQLILSSILLCCNKLEDQNVPENIFNMELIVQCIRASQNPQTHHHALLVLAHTAELVPTQVLHHVMAIFTFMGSSVLRHDDAYSFQIITKIIDTIIPILVTDNHIYNILKVLRVFVDALLDVPEHRRLPLYKHLLIKINVKENLYLFLLLLFESYVVHNSQEKQKSTKALDTSPKRLSIAANLCREFSPETVIYTCSKLLEYLKGFPDEKEDKMESDNECEIFSISNHTPKQFRHYKYTLITFISTLLASTEFVNQVAVLSEDETLQLEELYKDSIIKVLTYIQRTSKVADKTANTPQAQYWKIVLHHSYDILDSINALLTPQMFLLVTKGLMVHNLGTVRRRALELLNTKLQHNLQFFNDCDRNEIYSLIPPIIGIIETLAEGLEAEQEVIVQTALLSLKLLVKSLALEDPEKFVQILEFITNLLKSGKAKNNVLASVILCLSELCIDLRAHALSCLPNFMPPFLKILKNQKHQETSNLLLLSMITAVQKLLDSLPLFLSPYMDKLLFEIAILISKWGNSTTDQKLQPFVNKLTSIRQKIGAVIPARVLIPSLEQCYRKLIAKKYFNAVKALMEVLSESLKNLKALEIGSNIPELTNFFLKALQFRSEATSTLEEANIVEGHIVKALTVFILKLSESNFRPLYYKLFDWAVRNEVKSDRVITFYSLSSNIAESLKGIFVLFAGHFLNNAAQLLDAVNSSKTDNLYFEEESKNVLLLEYILKTLHAICMYDKQKFINKDRFEVLMQPMLDQLENSVGELDKRNKELLTPCIVQFALAVADDALWKQMNYQLLLKLRHASPVIRLVALHCLTEVVKKLGEDFLSLLPETIPILAELLEDEDENVEKACQKAVQEMERVLGEPLQKYF